MHNDQKERFGDVLELVKIESPDIRHHFKLNSGESILINLDK